MTQLAAPVLTVFIPVYNGEHYLPATLDSLLAQTFADWQLLLVDDGSTDGSYALLQSYAARDSRLALHRKPRGGDAPHAWLYAMPHIATPWVLYMSQDDLLHPRCLEQLVATQRVTDADAVIPEEYEYRDASPQPELRRWGRTDVYGSLLTGPEALRLMLDYSIPGFALWRTSIVRRVGMRTDTFNCDELAQRAWVAECGRVAFSEARFYWRRDNPASITLAPSARLLEGPLTAALLLQLAERYLPSERQLLDGLANSYSERLLRAMVVARQRAASFTCAERGRVASCHRRAHAILRRRCTLGNWKYRLGRLGWPLMCAVARFKCLQAGWRGVQYTLD